MPSNSLIIHSLTCQQLKISAAIYGNRDKSPCMKILPLYSHCMWWHKGILLIYNDENFLPQWQGNIFSSVEEAYEPTNGSMYCNRHWRIESKVGVGLTSREGSSKPLTLYIIRGRKHSLCLNILLKRAHSVRNENREKVCYVFGVQLHLCVWYETHSDIGA